MIALRFLIEDIAARMEPGDPASVTRRHPDGMERRPLVKPVGDFS